MCGFLTDTQSLTLLCSTKQASIEQWIQIETKFLFDITSGKNQSNGNRQTCMWPTFLNLSLLRCDLTVSKQFKMFILKTCISPPLILFDIDFYQISLFNCFLQCCSPRISMQPSLGALPGVLPLSCTQRTWNLHLLPHIAIMHACMLSCFSCIRPFATKWTVACQAPLSMGFSRQEYLSGLPFPSAESQYND